ncbi:MAG: recombinase RecT [Bacteriovoracaceae bacterium]
MTYQRPLQNKSLGAVAPASNPIAQFRKFATGEAMMNRFKEVLGDRAPQFVASVVSAVNTNKELLNADPNSVMASALVAATLDLDVNQGLGFAAIVPYKGRAQFQMMVRGYVQLAVRSGQYSTINAVEIYADEIDERSENILTGEVKLFPRAGGMRSAGNPDNIVGYAAYFRLLSGFEKTVYWPVEKIINHAIRYSKSYDSKTGRFRPGSAWADNFEAMARKTVLKNALANWGVMSVAIQKAVEMDQVITDGFDSQGSVSYAYESDQEEEQEQLAPPQKNKPSVMSQEPPEEFEYGHYDDGILSSDDDEAMAAIWGAQ